MRILLIEDSGEDALLMEEEFLRTGWNAEFHLVRTRQEVESALDNGPWDLIISDYDLGPFQAPDALGWVAQRSLDIPFLVVSDTLTEELAVSVLKAGAHDFFVKGNLARLVPAAVREWKEAQVRRERRKSEAALHRAEEALHRNEKLLLEGEKLKSIGILAGGIAHDFNNLMTAVNGFGQMALSRLEEDHPVHGMLMEIVRAGERAAELTQQILAFGQKQILSPKPLDLNEEVIRRQPFLSRIAGENVTIELDLDPDLEEVSIDPQQIGQALANLVANSKEAISGYGRILIRTGRIYLDGCQPCCHPKELKGDFAVLTVKDDGSGMDPGVALRVFEPYFTTKKAATRTGLGLGLSTVHGIVAQSRGCITVESVKGNGATFRVYLPLSRHGQELQLSKDGSGLPIAALKNILIADREPLVRDFLRNVLETRGYRIIEAESGRSAIGVKQAGTEQIDLILLDSGSVGMPAQDFALHCSTYLRNSRIIFMSTRPDPDNPNSHPRNCTARVLRKPFTPTSLLRLIDDALGSRSNALPRCGMTCLS